MKAVRAVHGSVASARDRSGGGAAAGCRPDKIQMTEPNDGPAAPGSLEAAYRATIYRVHTGSATFDLRVDAPSSQLAALMRRHGVATAAYLTACNPRSVRVPDAVNRSANDALRLALVRADAFTFDGEAVDPTGEWPPEPSFLALGISAPAATELGVRFGQNAMLFAEADAMPRLVWLPRSG
jgi:hypothetical protein